MKNLFLLLDKKKFKAIDRINRWLLRKSWRVAEDKAKKIAATTGKKVYVFLWAGDFVAMTKQDFKVMWQKRSGMKTRTLEQWKKYVHEF